MLFIGRHGTGRYCYGTGQECNDPADDSKGTHAYPYQHQVWAYDANELLAVKNGQKEPWAVRPYATWTLDDLDTSGEAKIVGAGYDPSTGRLYVAQAYGDYPRIDVFQITAPSATIPTLTILRQNNQPLVIGLSSLANQDCEYEVSSDLVNWTKIFAGRTDAQGHLDYRANESLTLGSRFYRAKAVTAP